MQAIVLAGGLGTRLRSAVSDVPKPMAPVRNIPFLEYLLSRLVEQGIDRFILSVGYRWGCIFRHFGNRFRNTEIVYSVESEPLGTGGALRLAVTHLAGQDDFFVVNGDTYFEVPLTPMYAFHRTSASEITIALTRAARSARYSTIECDEHGRVIVFGGPASPDSTGTINGGIYLMAKHLFTGAGSSTDRFSLENDWLPRAVREKKHVFGFSTDGAFLDIGIPQDFRSADSHLPEL